MEEKANILKKDSHIMRTLGYYSRVSQGADLILPPAFLLKMVIGVSTESPITIEIICSIIADDSSNIDKNIKPKS